MLLETEWDAVIEILLVLKPFYEATKQLQSVQRGLSDFYGDWIRITVKVSKSKNTELVGNIREQMEKWKVQLLHNPIMISAIFLDPRYQRGLSTEQKDLAIFFLTGLYQKLSLLESKSPENVNENHGQPANDSNSSEEEMLQYLNCTQGEGNVNPTINQNSTSLLNVEEALKEFIGVTESLKLPLMGYWEANKSKTVLYKLSQVIFAIPPTQTTVERAFSSLALILTPLRNRLSDENLQNILLVRLNQDILTQLRNEGN